MPSMQSKIFSEWDSAVNLSQNDYRSRIGCNFTPSRLSELHAARPVECNHSSSTESWRVPCSDSTEIRDLIASMKDLPQTELVSRCVSTISGSSKIPLLTFWSSTAEAAIRASQDPLVFAELLSAELDGIKLSRKRSLMHRLYGKIFHLKQIIYRDCDSDQKLGLFLSGLSATDPVIVSLRDTYSKLSRLEFHSTGKSKSGDFMSFMLKELLPFAIRDIPFAILKKIAMLCFDIDLFEDDYSRFWNAEMNSDYSHFRSDSSLHRWNDQSMMKSGAQIFSTSASDEPQDSPQDYGMITLAYEAPWILPNLQNPQSGTRAAPGRKTTVAAHPTARMVKLEGRRQSYKPEGAATNSDEANGGAICLVPATEDDGWPATTEFSIRRSSLGEIPGDWDLPGDCHNDDRKHGGISDVLEDLLGSPTRPSTQTKNSPENTKSRKRSLSRSPPRKFDVGVSETSPQTVIKKPCTREVNDENSAPSQRQNLRDLLWNDEPPISERTRKGGTPKDTRIKYNISK